MSASPRPRAIRSALADLREGGIRVAIDALVEAPPAVGNEARRVDAEADVVPVAPQHGDRMAWPGLAIAMRVQCDIAPVDVIGVGADER